MENLLLIIMILYLLNIILISFMIRRINRKVTMQKMGLDHLKYNLKILNDMLRLLERKLRDE